METNLIQAATAHIKPVHQKQELAPLKTGAAELEQALNATKVCNASVSELDKVLRRVMLLVGIRAANMPVAEESKLLVEFIYKKYAGNTLAEIQLAFEKAIAGELDCEACCYENFSPQYFGQIMSAYKKWASQKFNENQLYAVPQTKNLLTMPADWKELCETYYQDYLRGNLHLPIMPYQLYDEFVKLKNIAPDTYEDFLSEALVNICMALKMEIADTTNESTKHELKESINKITNGQDDFKVIAMAKKLAVQFLYKTAKEKGLENLFVKE